MIVRYARPTLAASCRFTSTALAAATRWLSCAWRSLAQATGATSGTVADRLPMSWFSGVATTLLRTRFESRRVKVPPAPSTGSHPARASRTRAAARSISFWATTAEGLRASARSSACCQVTVGRASSARAAAATDRTAARAATRLLRGLGARMARLRVGVIGDDGSLDVPVPGQPLHEHEQGGDDEDAEEGGGQHPRDHRGPQHLPPRR